MRLEVLEALKDCNSEERILGIDEKAVSGWSINS